MARALSLVSVALLAPLFASAGNVFIVGGPNPPYTTIQAAVNAAADGDLILVRPGSYSGAVVVTAKALTIAANPPLSATHVDAFRVELLPAGKIVSLVGLKIDISASQRCEFIDCLGSIRATDVQIRRVADDGPGILDILRCPDIALTRCNVQTSLLTYQSGNKALHADASNVAAFECLFRGAPGASAFGFGFPPQWLGPYGGAAGLWLSSIFGGSSAFLSGCSAFGGNGGNGHNGTCSQFGIPTHGTNGAAGGNGVSLDSSTTLFELGNSCTGGQGGAGGAPQPACGALGGTPGAAGQPVGGTGAQISWSAVSRSILYSPVAHEATPIGIDAAGAPGDLVQIMLAQNAGWQIVPSMQGVALLGSSPRRRTLGVLDPSGTLSTSIQFTDMGPGVLFTTFQVQAVFRDTLGQSCLGSASPLVVLDSSL